MKILSISVLSLRNAADRVSLHTDLPEAIFPYAGTLDLNFTVVKDGADAYLAEHFPGIPVRHFRDAG